MRAGDTRVMAAYFAQPHAMAAARETELQLPLPPLTQPSTPDAWTKRGVESLRMHLSTPFPGCWFDSVSERDALTTIRLAPIENVTWLFGTDSGLCHVLSRTLALLLPVRVRRALKRGDSETLEVLLTSTTFVTCLSDTEQCAVLDALGRNLLSMSSMSDTVVNVLLAHGMRVNAIDLWTKRMPLDDDDAQLVATVAQNGAWIVGCGHVLQASHNRPCLSSRAALVREMVCHGADVRDIRWHCVLDDVDTQAVRVLVEEGCVDVDSRSGPDQRTPLMVVAGSDSNLWDSVVELVTLLLDSGANVEARDKHGHTALMLAAAALTDHDRHPYQNDVVRTLLAYGGADVNARDDTGQTPLHHVCHAMAWFYPLDMPLDAAEQLVAHGADVTARDAEGVMPHALLAG